MLDRYHLWPITCCVLLLYGKGLSVLSSVLCAVAWPRCEWCCDCIVYCSTTPPCSNFTPSSAQCSYLPARCCYGKVSVFISHPLLQWAAD